MTLFTKDADTETILDAMHDREMSGVDLRNILNATRKTWWDRLFHRYSKASFYFLMADLEERGLVKGYYRQKLIAGGTIVKHRCYSTPGCRRFYS